MTGLAGLRFEWICTVEEDKGGEGVAMESGLHKETEDRKTMRRWWGRRVKIKNVCRGS